jgi:hypothetical protein
MITESVTRFSWIRPGTVAIIVKLEVGRVNLENSRTNINSNWILIQLNKILIEKTWLIQLEIFNDTVELWSRNPSTIELASKEKNKIKMKRFCFDSFNKNNMYPFLD